MIIFKDFNSLLQNPIHQYIYANKLKLLIKKPTYNTYLIKHKDNIQSSIDVLHAFSNNNTAIVLFHGLGGSSDSNYCTYIANHAKKHNITFAIYNRRGHGNNICEDYPEHYNEGDITDMMNMMKSLGYSTIHVIGVSIAGNFIIKYAAKHKDAFKTITLLSTTLDLSNQIEKVMKDEFIQTFLKSCSCDIIKNCTNLQPIAIPYFDTVIEQEAYCLNKTFDDMMKYYRDISAIQYLSSVKCPILWINSIDDPIINISIPKYKEYCEKNKNLTIILTNQGSHCAWVDIYGRFMPNKIMFNFMEI